MKKKRNSIEQGRSNFGKNQNVESNDCIHDRTECTRLDKHVTLMTSAI